MIESSFVTLATRYIVTIPLVSTLAMLQLVTGHGILSTTTSGRFEHWKEEPIWHSAVMGLLGGIIVSPFLSGIFLLLFHHPSPLKFIRKGGESEVQEPEDFFEDESQIGHGVSFGDVRGQCFPAWRTITLLVIAIVLGIIAGAVGGALAVYALGTDFGAGIKSIGDWTLTGTIGSLIVTFGGCILTIAAFYGSRLCGGS
jgi:hypothetical protein